MRLRGEISGFCSSRDCHPCFGTQKKYTYENGEWVKKKEETVSHKDENSQKSIGKILEDNLSSIPCGYVIKEIKKENGKYNLVIEPLPVEKSAQEDSQKRKELDEFYAQLKILIEENKQKKRINISDQKYKDNLNEFEKDDSFVENISTESSNENEVIQKSKGGPYEDYEFNLEKDIINLKGQHYDTDENGVTDGVLMKDENGVEYDWDDANEDGLVDYLTIRNPDNSAILIFDSDYDGEYDQMAVINNNEGPQYYPFEEKLYSSQNNSKIDEISLNTVISENKEIVSNELYSSTRGNLENTTKMFDNLNKVEQVVVSTTESSFTGTALEYINYAKTTYSGIVASNDGKIDETVDFIRDGYNTIASMASKAGGALAASKGGFKQFMISPSVFPDTFEAMGEQLFKSLRLEEPTPNEMAVPYITDIKERSGICYFINE